MSSDPTVGVQYRWSANLAPAYGRFWSLVQGNTYDRDTATVD